MNKRKKLIKDKKLMGKLLSTFGGTEGEEPSSPATPAVAAETKMAEGKGQQQQGTRTRKMTKGDRVGMWEMVDVSEEAEVEIMAVANEGLTDAEILKGLSSTQRPFRARMTAPDIHGNQVVQEVIVTARAMPKVEIRRERIVVNNQLSGEDVDRRMRMCDEYVRTGQVQRSVEPGTRTIIHEVDWDDQSEVSSRGCCHEGLEGRLSASRSCARDLPVSDTGAENVRTCGDGDHSECSGHGCYSDSSHEECRHQDNAPCDCCRHGHSLTSLIRNPDDCRSCLRHLGGGSYVSPKYPEIRERMLATLNQRRDHSEENSESNHSKVEAPSVVKSIPLPNVFRRCGRKERLIIVNPENGNEDVDDLVKRIEGVQIMSNDPKRAAKKARQKERKIQLKMDEEKRREDEERRIREEEERLKREQEEREEEERRKAEELKRQARKQKKKNRKKRDADKGNKTAEQNEAASGMNDAVKTEYMTTAPVVDNNTGPSDAVRKVLETINPVSQSSSEKSGMVTIRRHPAPENQNIVTIQMNDHPQAPVFTLVDGHLIPEEQFLKKLQKMKVAQQQPMSAELLEMDADSSEKGKKVKNGKGKKKGISETALNNETRVSQQPASVARQSIPILTFGDLPKHKSPDNHPSSPVDLESLHLPPGITITKVPSTTKPTFVRDLDKEKVSVEYIKERYTQHCLDDDDEFFVRRETEEFEEVVSNKTRRKRIKAAKTRDGSEENDSRDSPNSLKQAGRRPFICDTTARQSTVEAKQQQIENGQLNKWGASGGRSPMTAKTGLGKPTNTMIFTNKKHPEFQSSNTMKPKRDHQSRFGGEISGHVNNSSSNFTPVMPRLSRSQNINGSSPTFQNMYEAGAGAVIRQAPFSDFHRNQSPVPYEGATGVVDISKNQNIARVHEKPDLMHPERVSIIADQFSRVSGVVPSSHIHAGGEALPPQSQAAPPTQLWNQPPASVVNPVISKPFNIQAQGTKEDSWNPWKDWSEHSTPETPSPRYGFVDQVLLQQQQQQRREPPSKTYAFHELAKRSSKSPIQRPTHLDMHVHSQNNGFENFSRSSIATSAAPHMPRTNNYQHPTNPEASYATMNQDNDLQHLRHFQHLAAAADPSCTFNPRANTIYDEHANAFGGNDERSWNVFSGSNDTSFIQQQQQRRYSDKSSSEFVLGDIPSSSPPQLRPWDAVNKSAASFQEIADDYKRLTMKTAQPQASMHSGQPYPGMEQYWNQPTRVEPTMQSSAYAKWQQQQQLQMQQRRQNPPPITPHSIQKSPVQQPYNNWDVPSYSHFPQGGTPFQ